MNKIFALLPLIVSILAPSSLALPHEMIALSNAGVGGTRDIYISDFTGTPINLTNSPYDDMLPVWSSDGTKIAFLSNEPSQFGGDYRLHIVDVATHEVQQVSSQIWTSEANFAWSPDGRSIAVTLGALYMIDVVSGTTRQLSADNRNAQHPSWSSDSARLVYSAWGAVYAVNRDGGDVRSFTGSLSYQNQPEWSPVSDQILFKSFQEGEEAGVYVARNVDTSARLIATFPGAVIGEPMWSPDGRQIAVTVNESSTPSVWTVDFADIYVMNADGSNVHRITGAGDDLLIGWMSDSQHVMAFRGIPADAYVSVFAIDVNDRTSIQLSDETLDLMCAYGNCGVVSVYP